MSEYYQLNYQLNNDPDNYLLEFHPSGPSFNHYRRELRRIQNENKPPYAETENGLSEDDSTPEPYSPPSTSPSPPSSVATMDLEIMDMGRDVDETPVHTPVQRRARSLEPSISRLSMNTPNERYRQNPHYPHSSINTPAPPTPHAMAARRALEDRRMAMFTPGRTRRQSLREQRETPMLILRNLGRALAPTSKAIDSSSSPEKPSPNGIGNRGAGGSARGAGRRNSDDDDELPIDRPRLSLPIDEGSSDNLQPPHSSILDDPSNITVQSVELPRRATSEGPPRRSFGYLGDSDVTPWDDIYGNDDTNPDPFAYPPGIAPHAPTDPEIADLQFPPGVGRESDFSLDMPSGLSDNEQTTTFYMRSPVVDTVEAVPEDEDASSSSSDSDDSDDVPLMEGRQSERDRLLEQATEPEEQQGEQPLEQPSEPLDVGFPDLGDFEHVPDLGDAEMDALTRYDPETFAQDPVRPGDEWIGYPPGRPRKRRREDDESSRAAEAEAEAQAQAHAQVEARAQAQARARTQAQAQVRVSAHNIQYPPVTNLFVRQVVQHAAQNSALGHQRLAADALETFSRASEWFFRQLGDDLRAYAGHARRSMVEERDLVALMHRQRVINAEQSLFHLASHNLPRELQQLLRSNNPGYQPAYPVAQQSGIQLQQPLVNAQSETVTGLRPFVPNPPSPSHAGEKRKRDEDDDGESDNESLVFPEDDDY
ncbi:hypothetical protein TGAMA5MH_07870 [Trichoderma gamsii]|uniref:CENP-T/Histone H4 histone fold domain-containing protein n=1 Tax=Trichoderma gamsii TaxID=398673 RepID=A0A2K0T3Y3_9HYPO|nr:hypothetical protein TGAMA5MH_07870 [Trichoderma gamsii]